MDPVGKNGKGAERWIPRCPQCGATPILGPANGFTVGIADKLELACAQCPWRGTASDLKLIYVRI